MKSILPILLFLSLLCATIEARAQPGEYHWQRLLTLDREAIPVDMVATRDGGALLLSTTGRALDEKTPERSADILVVKVDDEGEALWNATVDLGGSETAMAIRETSDGGCIVMGTYDARNIDPAGHPFVVSLAPDGRRRWRRSFPDLRVLIGARPLAIAPDDGCVVALYKSIGPNDDAVVMRISPTGEIVWEKRYGASESDEWGGSISVDAKGAVFAISTSPRISPLRTSLLFVRTDWNGGAIWKKELRLDHEDVATTMIGDGDGGWIVSAGYRRRQDTSSGATLARIASDGSLRWLRTYRGTFEPYTSMFLDGDVLTAVSKSRFMIIDVGDGRTTDTKRFENDTSSSYGDLEPVATVLLEGGEVLAFAAYAVWLPNNKGIGTRAMVARLALG